MKKKGFTLIELIIVVSIIGILSAIMVQNFKVSIDKTKIQVDIQSAKVMTNAVYLYETEHGGDFATAVSGKDVVTFLTTNNYLKTVNAGAAQSGGIYKYDATKQLVILDLSGSTDKKIKDIYETLNSDDKLYVTPPTA